MTKVTGVLAYFINVCMNTPRFSSLFCKFYLVIHFSEKFTCGTFFINIDPCLIIGADVTDIHFKYFRFFQNVYPLNTTQYLNQLFHFFVSFFCLQVFVIFIVITLYTTAENKSTLLCEFFEKEKEPTSRLLKLRFFFIIRNSIDTVLSLLRHFW